MLDFTGVPQKIFTNHKRLNNGTEVKIEETFTYDHQNRLVKHEHQVNNQLPEILAQNSYNEIGQLQTKQVGNNIQEINYKYNIRGWLTQINDPANLGNDLFGYRINYNEELLGLQIPNVEYPQYAIEKKYNGNIAEVQWSFSASRVNTYGYVYDPMNRLMAGLYQNPNDPASREYSEILGYDLNGNIRNLKRTSFKPIKGSASFLIDHLTYTYRNANQSNQIDQITDAANNTSGYPGGGQAVSYDANGNMTAMPDKGITAIAFNFLNLPTQISQNGNTTNYFYRADGVKIKKKYTLVNPSGTHTINTEYLDGFQYSTVNTEPLRAALAEPDESTEMAATASQPETFSTPEERAVIGDPGNPPVDPNAVILSFFPTAEGYYDYENLRYIYQYKDHLGNVRVSYVQEASSLKVMDTNNYYPFGLSWLNPNTGQSVYDPLAIPYNYKYNGKELQETGMYDYGARFYMSDILIFGTHDPLSEKTLQPYAYAYSNPIKFIDPTGMEGEAASSDSSESGGGASEGGRDSYGNEVVRIIGNIPISAGTAAINVTHFGDGSGSGDGGGKKKADSNDKKDTAQNCCPDKSSSGKVDSAAGALMAGWAVALGEPTPVGEAVMAAATAGAILYYGPDLAKKMAAEIEGIRQRAEGSQGFQYALTATRDGNYPNVRGGTTYLNKGDVWKYGETTSSARYSDKYLKSMGLHMDRQFYGNQMQIKIQEKIMIYGYFFQNRTLPPGNKIFR